MIWVILGAFSVKFAEKSFFALFGVTQARPRDAGTIWVILGAFSIKFPEKSFFALFRVIQARPRSS
ncbi:hypothetical protein T10_5031 [Trichinella papuae]|uniref:Uncharacterized protein n=1 Tax=Trichinella papuae TaxID=268474 RepID=A0A0V1LZ35_9BILA|nr:hypothetical protein T10_5031 [Trichinella papuae]